MSGALASALYLGRLRHRRHAPVAHAFDLPLRMIYLDLDELGRVFSGRWLWSAGRPNIEWFRRRDYLDPDTPDLARAVRERVAAETGRRADGPVRVLTQLRSWGYCFNPVTFYYCHGEDDALEAIVTEITNTPWGERFTYVLDARAGERRGEWTSFRFAKRFHVSPFMPMALDYDWRFRAPGATLGVHMNVLRGGEHLFDATLSLTRREIDAATLAHALWRYPAMSLRVSARIYFEALRLWRKRVPFHPHPARAGAP